MRATARVSIPIISLLLLASCGSGDNGITLDDCRACTDGAEFCDFNQGCQPLLSLGAACEANLADRDPCATPNHCINAVCTAPRDLGEQCLPGGVSDCREGLTCMSAYGNPIEPLVCVDRGADLSPCREDMTCDDGLSCGEVYQYPDAQLCRGADLVGRWAVAWRATNSRQLQGHSFLVAPGGPATAEFPGQRLCVYYPSDCNPGAQAGACGESDVTVSLTEAPNGPHVVVAWPERAGVGDQFVMAGSTEGDLPSLLYEGTALLTANGRNDCTATWMPRTGPMSIWVAKCLCEGTDCLIQLDAEGHARTSCF